MIEFFISSLLVMLKLSLLIETSAKLFILILTAREVLTLESFPGFFFEHGSLNSVYYLYFILIHT